LLLFTKIIKIEESWQASTLQGSKVHSADQKIIWMTQHRALKLHMKQQEGEPLHIGTWPSLPLPPFSVYVKCYITQLLKGSIIVPLIIVGIDFESTSSIIGAIYALTSINKGVGVNTHVEQTDGVAAALGENTNVNHQISSSVVPDEGVQHQTIRFLTQRMERRRHGWIGST
ncbi:unnamed protein product, partial [Brassica napus]